MHEGKQLKNYLKVNEIKQDDFAKKLGLKDRFGLTYYFGMELLPDQFKEKLTDAQVPPTVFETDTLTTSVVNEFNQPYTREAAIHKIVFEFEPFKMTIEQKDHIIGQKDTVITQKDSTIYQLSGMVNNTSKQIEAALATINNLLTHLPIAHAK